MLAPGNLRRRDSRPESCFRRLRLGLSGLLSGQKVSDFPSDRKRAKVHQDAHGEAWGVGLGAVGRHSHLP